MPQPLPKTQATNVAQLLALALQHHHAGRFSEAEPLYAQILTVRPDHFDALQMMALVKLAKGDAAEALRLVSIAMGVRKPSPQVLLNHGLILNALARHQDALDSFDQAIKQKSKYAEAHNNRGAALAALGRHEDALESFAKAISLKPDYAEAHYNMGSSLRVLGRYDEALKSFDRALTLRPTYAKAHNNRGNVLEATNRLTEALDCYDKALALDARFTEPRKNRGRVLIGLDRAEEAVENFTTALRLNPRDPEAWYQRGSILLELSRNEEAAKDLAQALALEPGHAQARLAACLAELPVVYAQTSDIATHRAAYEQKLRALASDADSGALQGDLISAIGSRHPFLLAYQGADDRGLQQVYGEMIGRIVGRSFQPAPLPPPPAPGEPIRVGIVSSFFYRHSNWKIPIKGWVSQLDRMAARNPCRCAARVDLPRFAHGHIVAATCRAAARTGAMQFMGPSGNQWPADDGLFFLERSDGAAGRAKLLHRETGSAAEPLDLLRARGERTGFAHARGIRPASGSDRVLERTIAVQIPAAI
jgi:protein O-GlcNAc transferase